ncbi:MAG: type II toxin-antitoxin system RelE/ParE family toxin [Spirochaetia bacterium]
MGNVKVIWTKPALNDLDEIFNYIASDSVDIAIKQYERIKETVKDIGTFPKQGRIIPELQNENITKFRDIIVNPWRMMYRIEENRILILAIIDGRRNIEESLMKRQLR